MNGDDNENRMDYRRRRCVLDNAIFSNYDCDGWTEENVVW